MRPHTGVGERRGRTVRVASRRPLVPRVTHEDGATAIGNDPNTMKALAFAPREEGVHNLVMHGHPNGLPFNTPFEIPVAAVRANPSYREGMPVRLIMC
ncbi:hypothetical protein ACFYYB_33180 [Streptomyces sp. NPDC002886]|uniref:hypothetical protein n=1 Tax=Streptomyces sp. NPDC002886 TaxID=3364667 RepID=UPI0036987DB7